MQLAPLYSDRDAASCIKSSQKDKIFALDTDKNRWSSLNFDFSCELYFDEQLLISEFNKNQNIMVFTSGYDFVVSLTVIDNSNVVKNIYYIGIGERVKEVLKNFDQNMGDYYLVDIATHEVIYFDESISHSLTVEKKYGCSFKTLGLISYNYTQDFNETTHICFYNLTMNKFWKNSSLVVYGSYPVPIKFDEITKQFFDVFIIAEKVKIHVPLNLESVDPNSTLMNYTMNILYYGRTKYWHSSFFFLEKNNRAGNTTTLDFGVDKQYASSINYMLKYNGYNSTIEYPINPISGLLIFIIICTLIGIVVLLIIISLATTTVLLKSSNKTEIIQESNDLPLVDVNKPPKGIRIEAYRQ